VWINHRFVKNKGITQNPGTSKTVASGSRFGREAQLYESTVSIADQICNAQQVFDVSDSARRNPRRAAERIPDIGDSIEHF